MSRFWSDKNFSRATELGEDNSNYILTQIYNMILAIKTS